MAGLYIHIPFCESRCIYCGFYSTTLAEMKAQYVEAVCREMEMRGSIPGIGGKEGFENLETVYLGGGTPSQLSPALLQRFFDCLSQHADLSSMREITMECNPDDLTDEYVEALRQLPVNRVSMGAQTFSDDRLRFLHRRHTARQVTEAVERLRRIGIRNISIDLMFGFPGETLADWEEDIRQALALQVEHISAYSLMYEEGTALHRMLQQGKISETDEDTYLKMYETLIDRLTAADFEHYEISNFARRTEEAGNFRSKHNSSYWNGTPYIGLGAAAHSYDIDNRWWNVSDVREYIRRISEGGDAVEEREVLDSGTRYDDMVMTALRTADGLRVDAVEERFGTAMKDHLMRNAQPHLEAGRLQLSDGTLSLTRQGLFVSDSIMSDLMYV